MVATRKKTTTAKIGLTGSLQVEIKCYILKNVIFWKKGTKVKNITILHFMTTFHNFALRIRTGGASWVLKPNETCLIRCKQITIT